MATREDARVFLFLQGPVAPFFKRLADRLERDLPGARAIRVNLNFGDWWIWRRPGGRAYRGRLKDWPEYIENLIVQEGVTDVLLLGEQREYHKAAIAAAKRHGADVIATDFGYLRPDWLAFERDGLSGASHFPTTPEAVKALADASPEPDFDIRFRDPFWKMALQDIVYHVGAWFYRPFYPFYRSHQPNHPFVTYWGTGLRFLLQRGRTKRAEAEILRAAARRPAETFVFPLQIERDFSLRAYSPFPDLETPIRHVIDSFARNAKPDATLILKVHPLDPGLRSWRKVAEKAAREFGAEGRVIYIDGGDLTALLKVATGVVVVNSTVGLLSLTFARPTIALGRAVYDIAGATARDGLDAFWRNPTPPRTDVVDDIVRALAGAHMIRGTFYTEPGLSAAVEAAAARLIRRTVNQPEKARGADGDVA